MTRVMVGSLAGAATYLFCEPNVGGILALLAAVLVFTVAQLMR